MRAFPHVVLTVVITQLTSSHVTAQERKPFDLSRFNNILVDNAPGTPAGKMFGLATRVTAGRYFELGPNGVVAAFAAAPLDAHDSDVDSLQSRNENANQSQPTNGIYIRSTPITRNYAGSLSTDQLAAHECGPSPMAPTEIENLVSKTATRYGIDPNFAKAIAWTESHFDQIRNSPKGARGPMQLIPDTAKRFGITDICDPASNIDGGMRYLRSLIDRFGNPLLAAAAYNAGEQRVYQHHGVPPFAETVRYVADVLNYQLGLVPPELSPTQPAKSSLTSGLPQPADIPDVIGATRSAKFVGGVMQF